MPVHTEMKLCGQISQSHMCNMCELYPDIMTLLSGETLHTIQHHPGPVSNRPEHVQLGRAPDSNKDQAELQIILYF